MVEKTLHPKETTVTPAREVFVISHAELGTALAQFLNIIEPGDMVITHNPNDGSTKVVHTKKD